MKKEIWSKVILILGMVISFPNMYAYDFEVDSVYYNIISMDDMTCEIDGGHPDMTVLNLSGVVSFKGREFKINGMKREAFRESKIVSLSVKGLEEIPERAFYACDSLKTVNLESVKLIGKSAFNSCKHLAELNLGVVETIANYAFSYCPTLSVLNVPGSLNSIGDSALPRAENIRVMEGDGLLSLSNLSLYECKILQIDRNISEVERLDFWDSTCFENVTFGNTVTVFPSYLGAYLDEWDLSGNNIKVINKRAFYRDNPSKNIFRSIKLPLALDSIKEEAFYDTKIDEIILPESLHYLGESVFEECENLKSIDLPGSLNTIPKSAFRGCKNLKYVKLGGAKVIGEKAFYGCAIPALEIPGSVELIGADAFLDCKNLKSLEIASGASPLILQQGVRDSQVLVKGKTCKTVEEAYASPKVSVKYMRSPFLVDSLNYLKLDRRIEYNVYDQEDIGVDDDIYYYMVLRDNYFYSFNFPNTKITKLIVGDHSDNPFVANPDTIENSYNVFDGHYKDIHEDTYYFSPSVYPEALTELREISCQMTTPPELTADFTNSVYMNAVLRVPYGAKAAYEQAPYWKNFWEIMETDDFTSTDTIKQDIIDNMPVEWYDINGYRMSGDFDTFPKGIYICRQGNKTKKILKR